jgi:hypothetical protein
VGCASLAAASQACYAPPAREDEVGEERDPLDLLALGVRSEYWALDGEPPALGGGQVAIAEFAVEFVHSRWLLPGPGGTAIVEPAGVTHVVQVVGVGLRETDFPDEVRGSLPPRLLAHFQAKLGKMGCRVLSEEVLRRAPAYAAYRTERVAQTHTPLDPFGTDTGRIRRTTTVGGAGFRVIDGALDDRSVADIDRAVLAETGASVLVRARFRVGVYAGAAALEAGSRIELVGPRSRATLRSRRSIVSEDEVLAEASFLPVQGHREVVDPTRFLEALDRLFPIYLDLAFPGAPPAAAGDGAAAEADRGAPPR